MLLEGLGPAEHVFLPVSRLFTVEEGKRDFRKCLVAHAMAWLNNKPTENWFGLLLSYSSFATSDRWVTQKVLKSCSNICMSIQMRWELQQLPLRRVANKISKLPVMKKIRKTFYHELCQIPQGNMHSTVLLYPI